MPYIGEETFPGRLVQSDDQLVDVCRRLGSPGARYAGTCKKGQDRLAVVDENLRVRGVRGLRVVDGPLRAELVPRRSPWSHQCVILPAMAFTLPGSATGMPDRAGPR